MMCMLAGLPGWAQQSPQAVSVVAEEVAQERWSQEASVYAYFTGDEEDYLLPIYAADRGRLHLEARYNYEDFDTGSAWIGMNFSLGETLAFEFTPMLGGVFGATKGLALGFEGSLSWWKLEFTIEAEYLFDADDSEDNFFYTWSELTLAPVDWFVLGLALQRTKLYANASEVSPGVLMGCTVGMFDLTAYVFDPGDDHPTYVFAVAIGF